MKKVEATIHWFRCQMFDMVLDRFLKGGMDWFCSLLIFKWFFSALQSSVTCVYWMVHGSDIVLYRLQNCVLSFAITPYLLVFQQMPGIDISCCLACIESFCIFYLFKHQIAWQLHILYWNWFHHLCEALLDGYSSTGCFSLWSVVIFWLMWLVILMSYQNLYRFSCISSSFQFLDHVVSNFRFEGKLCSIVDFGVDFHDAIFDHVAAMSV